MDELNFTELSALIGVTGGAGGIVLIAIIKLILGICKIWKECRDDNKTRAETITIILKSITPNGKKVKKINKSKK